MKERYNCYNNTCAKVCYSIYTKKMNIVTFIGCYLKTKVKFYILIYNKAIEYLCF